MALALSAALAALLCWAGALSGAQRAGELSRSVGVRFAQDALTMAQWNQAGRNWTEDGPGTALWAERGEQSLTGIRPASAKVTEVAGDIQLVMGGRLLAGNWPAPDDKRGCAVSRAAADALWGDPAPLGCAMEWAGEQYFVRAVYEGEGVVVQASEEDGERRYSSLELLFPEAGNGREAAGRFLSENGFPEARAILDGPFLSQCLSWLVLLPAWVLVSTVAIRWLKLVLRTRKRALLCLMVSAAGALALAAMLWAAQFQLFLPERWIPSRWSDFSFWTKLAREIGEQIRQAAELVPNGKDLAVRGGLMQCLIGVAGAGVGLLPAILKTGRSTPGQALGIGAVWAVEAFAALALFGTGGGRALWLAFPAAAALLALAAVIEVKERKYGGACIQESVQTV